MAVKDDSVCLVWRDMVTVMKMVNQEFGSQQAASIRPQSDRDKVSGKLRGEWADR